MRWPPRSAWIASGVVALAACRGPSTPRRVEAPPRAAPSSASPPTLRVGDRVVALRHARATLARFDTLVVELSDRPLSDAQPDGAHVLRVELPAGPGRRYFTDAPLPLAVLVRLADAPRTHEVPAYRARVRVEPFARAVGARVRVSVSCRDTGAFGDVTDDAREVACEGGAVDVPLVAIEARYDGTAPSDVEDTPVTGRVGGRPFTTGSALAVLGVARDGARHVRRLYLFEAPDVGCADRHRATRTGAWVVVSPWGGDGFAAEVGVTMPALPGAGFNHDASAWIRFDALEARVGAPVRGALYEAQTREEGAPPTELESVLRGRFAGTVCEDTPDPYVLPPPSR